jgi:membrane protein CcdC involved in cytochrome C biogenesis
MNIRSNPLFYAAAATTAIAGILHLIFASNVIGSNTLSGMFFIVAGIAQIFWALPTIRRWGKYGTMLELQVL